MKANPTSNQKLILSQWMGCARLVWNAKVAEEKYYRTFACKYYPRGTYAPIDQKTSQFKSKELTPWLYKCPSQIIRNSAVNWYQTYQKFMKGLCGKPKIKPTTDRGSIYLTREVFSFDTCEDGNVRLFIGTKTNNIGYLSFKKHHKFEVPNSIYIRKERGQYYVSFCYENRIPDSVILSDKEHLHYLQGSTNEYLEENVVGIDRGVAIPAHAGFKAFDFSDNQKKRLIRSDRYIKRLQRRLAKQEKGSNRRNKTKYRLAKHHAKKASIRLDFCHKTSRTLVDSQFKVFVFEDLKTSNMTRKAKPKQDEQGKYLPNQAKAKTGLNKAILNAGWHFLESFTKYKAKQIGKAVFKVSAAYTSQECAKCDHTHPDNRKSQDKFVCGNCGHVDNADNNASKVIGKRAINLILNTGTVLSERGVLCSDIGRGGKGKTGKRKRKPAHANETSKKIRLAA
jgi:putative transposase